MKIKPILQSQYLAALAMLKQAVVKCPPEVWDDPGEKDRFWFVAYHTLYYAHRYLKARDEGYARWEKRPHDRPGAPMTKAEVLEKLSLVEKDMLDQIPVMNLEEPLPDLENKLELQLYNIRHIQQHTGELYQRLSDRPVKLGWVSQRRKEKKK